MILTDKFEKKVCLPVVFKEGRWELFGGDPLPTISDGAMGDLWLSAFDLESEDDQARWTEDETRPLLKAGSDLWIEVARDQIPEELRTHVIEKRDELSVPHSCVRAILLDELSLIVRPGKKACLSGGKCRVPAINLVTASVNEAYTRVSIAFEPSRRGHTGNVFRKVFAGAGKRVETLDVLRSRALAAKQ